MAPQAHQPFRGRLTIIIMLKENGLLCYCHEYSLSMAMTYAKRFDRNVVIMNSNLCIDTLIGMMGKTYVIKGRSDLV